LDALWTPDEEDRKMHDHLNFITCTLVLQYGEPENMLPIWWTWR